MVTADDQCESFQLFCGTRHIGKNFFSERVVFQIRFPVLGAEDNVIEKLLVSAHFVSALRALPGIGLETGACQPRQRLYQPCGLVLQARSADTVPAGGYVVWLKSVHVDIGEVWLAASDQNAVTADGLLVFNGRLRDLRIYDRALSEAEIGSLSESP